jgi:hypothetical protein
MVQLILRYGISPIIIKLELNRLSLIAQPGAERLLTLNVALFDPIQSAIFDKSSASPAENKRHVELYALVMERLDPIVMAGTSAAVVFPN